MHALIMGDERMLASTHTKSGTVVIDRPAFLHRESGCSLLVPGGGPPLTGRELVAGPKHFAEVSRVVHAPPGGNL
jgi:hypothetical protein